MSELPAPRLSGTTKGAIGVVLAVLVMAASYLGIQSPCPECPVCPAPAATP